jgi:hypothetical protein
LAGHPYAVESARVVRAIAQSFQFEISNSSPIRRRHRERKRINPSSREGGAMDCFVASASRNDEAQIQLRILAACCARGLRVNRSPFEEQRARGMPGAQCTRSLVRAGGSKYAHEYSQRKHRITSGIPHAMVLRLMSRSPWGPGLLAPIVREIISRP